MHMRRSELLDILAVIQARPENAGRDITTIARTCTGPGDLREYVFAQWRRLGSRASQEAVAAYVRGLAAAAQQIAA
jgi:hypothetical protein